MRKVKVNGKDVWVKDPGDEVAETADVETGDPAEGVDAEAKEIATAMAKTIVAEVKKELGEVNVPKAANRWIDAPGNQKLREILHGKDLFTEKDKLTKEEKIVGFYHALVTRNEAAIKALAEGVAADGGNLFPDEFLSELIKPLAELPRARSLVRVVPMRRDVLQVPTASTLPKVYWTAENAAKTTTTATFGQVTLTARKAAAILYASDELIEDSTEIDVVQTIISMFADAIGQAEDFAILAGNGTTQPTGLYTARANGTIPSGAVSGNLDFDDMVDCVYRLAAKYRAGASWIIHPNNVKELRKLKDSNGRYLWEESPQNGIPARVLGYPVHEFYDAEEGEILFGNWKLCYMLGDRKQMTVKVSNETETAFTRDQTAIRVVFRLAGNVVLGEAANAITGIP